MRILVTRPEPDAARTAQALRERGHEAVVGALMRVEPVEASFAGPFDGVLMTSANAARAIATHPDITALARLPVLTVGARSEEAAREAGFANVASAEGALGDLAALAVGRFSGKRLLYLAGEDRAGDLAGALLGHGITVETAVIYRAVAHVELPVRLADELRRADAALHYSRRSAMTLLALAGRAGLTGVVLALAHYCVSEEAAGPLRQAGAQKILIAAAPTEFCSTGVVVRTALSGPSGGIMQAYRVGPGGTGGTA